MRYTTEDFFATHEKKSTTKIAMLGLAAAACGLGSFMLARNKAQDNKNLSIAGF